MHAEAKSDTAKANVSAATTADTAAEENRQPVPAMEMNDRSSVPPMGLHERKSIGETICGRTPPPEHSLFEEYEEQKYRKKSLFFVSVGTFKKPLDIFRALAESASTKHSLGFIRTFVAGIMAGLYIAAGGLFSIIVGGGMPEIQATDPGVQKLAFASVFPVGLLLVKVTGAELWTGNASTMATGLLNGKASYRDVLFNWSVAWLSNFLGSMLFAYFLVYLAGILEDDPWKSFTIKLAEKKIDLDPGKAILRGIGANWLVCLATTLGTSAQSVTGKMLGIWFPITAFVAIGYEHSVANMFFCPLGLMYGAKGGFHAKPFFEFVAYNLLPVTFGNVIGGAVFVSMLYHVYLGPVPFGDHHDPHGQKSHSLGGHGGVMANVAKAKRNYESQTNKGTVSIMVEHVMQHNAKNHSGARNLIDLPGDAQRSD
mmetsp:Transcript_10850/g.26564  ORF Transcript_10850/g.26564 Transcript_10850/m.26564 type:complete len:427 (-) Transcript_10850:216-1496(-)|eukprot:CAMPEP_0114516784 /NCGR_PEP_ID=MMETSP0109-20121206/17522_1 /TAXON_ID=29199 /ORGANISM="Chlorarachnion reptans, Strain CCCM449" /LENGTH=426 /DNA_ID=CAMNT_0001697215 /DNA_START=225 /DNA_END=1505 /DNA_ORIENTATION=-